MIDYIFREVEINKILSGAVKDNIPSCKIFERLEFKKICDIKENSPYTFHDGVLVFSKYELTKEDYIFYIIVNNVNIKKILLNNVKKSYII